MLGFHRSESASRLLYSYRSGRETSTGYKHYYPEQRFFAVPYSTVHVLSSPCSECILCWSFCRGFIVRRLSRGYALYAGGPRPSPCTVFRCPLAKLTNPWYKLWSGCGSGFDLSPRCGSGFWFLFDADPDADLDSSFHPDADPDPSRS